MIYKYFELEKKNSDLNKIILLYGKNDRLKELAIENLTKDKKESLNYDETEILSSPEILFDEIFSKSLFDEHKTLIVKRVTDKILNIVKEICFKKLEGIRVILTTEILEKKSKLRSFFEKNEELICVPFYPDNAQTLLKLAYEFLRQKNIVISSEDINLIVNKCNGDRKTLLNELEKIELFSSEGKKISTQEILKLVNLAENFSISELVNNCLAKNKKKIINILNENNFSNEDAVLIVRSLMAQSKKLLQLSLKYEVCENISETLSSARPPIFWKDKEIVKKQVLQWPTNKIKILIYNLNDLELRVKKNINNSIHLITDFILENTSIKTNN
tara:strand:- start:506 stop:1498 length:993 start_codon:yes stop_codon:yes gene_type:complete